MNNPCIICGKELENKEDGVCDYCLDDVFGEKQINLYKQNRNHLKKEITAKRIKLS